ncbi:MAG TPA: STAS domain-containing protein [Terracidiphilus sp.]|jgi:anti-anti-sigma factor|nr:STAS domain-containing protein [Terracidiphilus sp.]
MSTAQPQNWMSTRFSIERTRGKAPGTVIITLAGPFTARDMYGTLTPVELKNALDLQPAAGEEPAVLNILDLTAVPYMDSCGLGLIVTHYVSSQNRGVKMVAVGASTRVLELMRLTKVDTIVPLAATVEAAELV